MHKALTAILIFLGVSLHLSTAQYSFVTYDHTNGLPLDMVRHIVEDSAGYIWLGGALGLSRFDGQNFTHYYQGSKTHEVAGNVVNDIDITPSGNVVIVYDDNGVSVYDHKTDSFRNKNYNAADGQDFPQHSIIFSYILNDSIAYLGANREGMYRIHLRTMKSEKIPIGIIPYDMLPDPENDQSFLVSGKGLYRINPETLEKEMLQDRGHARMELHGNEVWYKGYNSWVKKYNLKTKKVKPYHLSQNWVIRGWTLVGDHLWVGTAEGIEVIDTATAEILQIIKSGNGNYDLPNSFIHDIYKDSKDRIWVTTDVGISLHDPHRAVFERSSIFSSQTTYASALSQDQLVSLDFYENRIEIIDSNGNTIKMDINGPLRQPLKVVQTPDQILVIFYNGIGVLDEGQQVITPLECPFTEGFKRGLYDLVIHDQYWVGIYRIQNIMVAWDRETNTLDTVDVVNEPRNIFNAKDGNVWIYGVNVFWRYNLSKREAQEFPLTDSAYLALDRDIVKIDKAHDKYWISTKTNSIWSASYGENGFELRSPYGQDKGLTNNSVKETFVDEFGNLIVKTRSGVFILHPEQDRFVSIGGKSDLNIPTTYGLFARDSIVYALGYKTKSLQLSKVDTTAHTLKTIIKKVIVNGTAGIFYDQEVTRFPFHENNISVIFSAIDFKDPANVRHRYRLSEDEDWIYLDPSAKSIQLSALAVGDYDLQISAGYGNGIWSVPASWRFVVQSPFWKKWWFLLLVLGAFAALGYLVYKVRMKQVNRLNAVQLRLAEMESESLRAQMNPHFIFNALNSIKAYIIKSDKAAAADYLTTFSELIRAVLHNSKQKEISLQRELDALTLYLEIERFRLNDKFNYSIQVEEGLATNRIAFPPLIIQPFVENSIWHGFVNKTAEGHLLLKVYKEADLLKIEVIDDGIGREASKRIEKSRGRERSYGIAITRSRLDNITDAAEIEIVDLLDDNRKSAGTKVLIKLPFKFIESNIATYA